MIQVKFLEQWQDVLNQEKSILKGEPDFFLDGQLNVLNTIISINNKQNTQFKTLKSFLKTYTKKVKAQSESSKASSEAGENSE